MTARRLSPKGKGFLHQEEGFVGKPYWPGSLSGITLDPGDDLGYRNLDTFSNDWRLLLAPAHFNALCAVIGLKGPAARDALVTVKDVPIPRSAADAIFEKLEPRYAAAVVKAFPGADLLPDNSWTAFFSLCYNRGNKLEDNDPLRPETWRREEMRTIRDYVGEGNLPMIADLFVIMGRIWEGGRRDDDGLVGRREREAQLIDPHVRERMGKLRELRRAA